MTLIGAGLLIGFYSAITKTSQAQQNQVRPIKASFDCDTAGAVTVTQEGDRNSDRYTYEAVNNRGETLRIPNGNSYTDNSSRVYTFTTGDTRFLIEDQGNGKATLSTSQGGGNYTNFNCTVASSNNESPGSNVVPALW